MKAKPCAECGEARAVMVRANVYVHAEQIDYGLKWLCIKHLLAVLGFDYDQCIFPKEIWEKRMEVVKP